MGCPKKYNCTFLDSLSGSEKYEQLRIVCDTEHTWAGCPLYTGNYPGGSGRRNSNSSGGMKLKHWWIICGVALIVNVISMRFNDGELGFFNVIWAITFIIAIYKSFKWFTR